jgi:hypothetical protein
LVLPVSVGGRKLAAIRLGLGVGKEYAGATVGAANTADKNRIFCSKFNKKA